MPAADLRAKLAELREVIVQARGMPLSTSCLIPRERVLQQIADIDAALPARLAEAEGIVADADAVLAQAREDAVAILAEAAVERDRRLEMTTAGAEASAWAEQVRAEADADAAARRAETDDYVDAKLAHFEVVLEKTLELLRRPPDPQTPAAGVDEVEDALQKALSALRRGRDRLHGRDEMADLGDHVDRVEASTEVSGPLEPLPEEFPDPQRGR